MTSVTSDKSQRDQQFHTLHRIQAEVEQTAMERSKNGVARPIFYKGEQVGEWRHHDERLTMFLLRFRRRHRFGPPPPYTLRRVLAGR